MILEPGLQALENLIGFLDRRLDHVDLLKPPRQRPVFLEDAAILLIGGRADALHLARGQHRLDQIRGVHHPAGGRAGADDGVNFIDEQDGVALLAQLRQHRLQPLLEIAAILGARHQRAQIQGVHRGVAQHIRHLAVHDHLGQALGDGGLADPGLADEQRVVLAPPTENLNGALDLLAAADQRIDATLPRHFVEVAGEILQRLGALVVGRLLTLVGGSILLFLPDLGDTVRNVIHHVQPVDFLLLEEIHRLGFLLAEQGDQHVGAGDFPVAGGLHVQHRPLQHPLESQGRLGLARVVRPQDRRVVADEDLQIALQFVHLGAAGPQHLGGCRIVQQSQQQMLDGHELVAPIPRLAERKIDGEFQILAQHTRTSNRARWF